MKKRDNLQVNEWMGESTDKYLIWEIIYGCVITILMMTLPVGLVVGFFMWDTIRPHLMQIGKGAIIGFSILPFFIFVGTKYIDNKYKK